MNARTRGQDNADVIGFTVWGLIKKVFRFFFWATMLSGIFMIAVFALIFYFKVYN